MKLFLLFFLAALGLWAQEFELKLAIQGGHVRELYLGCKPNATPGYDRKLDMYVPPAGMAAGFTGLDISLKNGLFLYKDFRPCSFPQTWKIACAGQGNQLDISFKWDSSKLPVGMDFTIQAGDGSVFDMRKISGIIMRKPGNVVIQARKK